MNNLNISNGLSAEILERSIVGVILLNAKEEIVLWNHWVTEKSGIPKSEVLGLSIFTVFPDILNNRVGMGIKDALQNRQSALISPMLNNDDLLLFKTNEHSEKLQLIFHITPLISEKECFCLIQINDNTSSMNRENRLYQILEKQKITEQKLTSSQKELETIIDNLPAVFFTKDSEGRHLMVNRRWEEAVGVSKKTAIGKVDKELFPVEVAETLTLIDQGVLAGKVPVTVEETVPHPDGSKHDYLSTKVPLLDDQGQATTLIGIATDITELKQLHTELAEAKEAAEAANLAKSNFLSNMSHELRTPLNVILGYARILQNDPAIDNVQQEKIITIEKSGKYLLEQISDILDVAKIEANKTELILSSVNIKNYVEYICNNFNLHAGIKGIELNCIVDESINLTVQIDERRLQQILLNLIGNAINFTEKGKVVIKIEPCDFDTLVSENESCLQFSVEDSGIGIAKESMDKIFQPFVQLKQKNNKIEGTGLGLNIAQQLVKLMGSELKVESELNKGSRFWFNLILSNAEKIDEQSIQRREMPIGYIGKKQKILVVDDMKDNRELIRDILTTLGIQVVVASKGLDSVIIAKDMQPNLILMDLLMPGLNGYESLTRLRNISECKDIPVIAMSASVHEEKTAILAGFDYFLPKPASLEHIISILGRFLNLEWRYTSEELGSEETTLLPPAKVELEKLRDLIQLGKMKRIIEWADDLQANFPEHTDFALYIRKLAKNFNDEKLIEFISQYQDKREL